MPARYLARAAARPFRALFGSDAFEGVLLLTIAAAAMLVANSGLSDEYHEIFHAEWAWSPIPKLSTAHLWINDALMAVFFFVVGLEVKREVVSGNLSHPSSLRLPVIAAVLGMAMPAAVYLALTGDEPGLHRGWAIPAATDIAFAMGVIGLLGKRVPMELRLFLLTVAIVDDIGAVLIIALVYTTQLKLTWLFASMAVAGLMMIMNWRGVDRLAYYVIGALLLWFCVLNSGIHATIAGVVAAFTIPMRRSDGTPLVETIEHSLVGWNAYFIVPIFGFANAGVDMRGLGLETLMDPLPLAIAGGLVIGKQVGVFGAVLLAEKLGIAPRPAGASWFQIWGLSALCGIGFTMSLFIGTMAFGGDQLLYQEAKLGVLGGTLISLILGYALLRLATPPMPVRR